MVGGRTGGCEPGHSWLCRADPLPVLGLLLLLLSPPPLPLLQLLESHFLLEHLALEADLRGCKGM